MSLSSSPHLIPPWAASAPPTPRRHPKTAGQKIDTVILISGRGSNMEALVRAAKAGEIPIRITHVMADREEAAGLKIADGYGIECVVVPDLGRMGQELRQLAPGLVCMAGFMRILPPEITEEYVVLNIHPSLLPMYPGLHAQRQAVEDGAEWSGCTVHFADEGVDTGPIIIQRVVPVLPGDTEETLSERILKEEHTAYPHAVGLVAARMLEEGTGVFETKRQRQGLA